MSALAEKSAKRVEFRKDLQKRVAELEVKVEMLEKALLFLAERLDETDLELGVTANNEYLVKQILQK